MTAVCPGRALSCPRLASGVRGALFRTDAAKRTLGPKNAKGPNSTKEVVVTLTISHRVNIDGYAHEPTLHAIRWGDLPIPALTDRLDLHDVEGNPVRGRVIGRTFTDMAVTLFVEEMRAK